ncbi:MAG: OmpW family outer membrane protein [Pseudomonadota bacterium]
MLMSTVISGLLALTMGTEGVASNDWLVRVRGVYLAPLQKNSDVLPTFTGGSADVLDTLSPEIDITYFFTPRWAVEVLGGVIPLDLDGTGILEGLDEVGEVKAFPPTVLAQYHLPKRGRLHPYVGVGVNYTKFYDAKPSRSLTDMAGDTTINVDGSWGVAFQAGADIDINDKWVVNADLKWIQIDMEARLDPLGIPNTMDLDLDPIAVGIGVGRRF